MEQTKKTNGAELSNEVMRVAAEGPRHDVPTGWPEALRTDKAIKLAYALEAAGYLNEDWQPVPKLRKRKTLYTAERFKYFCNLNPSYVLAEYWKLDYVSIGVHRGIDDIEFKSKIDAIVENLRKEEKAEKKALDHIPESRDDDEEPTPRYIAAVSKIEMPHHLQKDLRQHLVAAIYSHLLTENYFSFTNSLGRVQYDIGNAADPYTAGEFLADHIQEIFEKILSEVAGDTAVLLCRVSQPIK